MKSPLDIYQTPRRATEALIREVEIPRDGYVLEPCAGKGNIVRVLSEHKYDVVGCEINERYKRSIYSIDWVYGDFISITKYEFGRLVPAAIVGNPPFSMLKEFIIASLKYKVRGSTSFVALLMPINTLCGKGRFSLNRHYPPTCLLTFSERITFEDINGDSIGTPWLDCAWFIWEKEKQPLRIIPI